MAKPRGLMQRPDLPLWKASRCAANRLTAEQQRLVEANHKLARRIVAKLRNRQDVARLGEDALSHAFIGLCNAARTFRPELGLRFSTPAWTCIVREVLSAARREQESAALPLSSLEGFDLALPPTIVEEVDPEEWNRTLRSLRRLANKPRRRRKKKKCKAKSKAKNKPIERYLDLSFPEAVQDVAYRMDAIRMAVCGRRMPGGFRHRRPTYRRSAYRFDQWRRLMCGTKMPQDFQHGRAA